MFACARGQSLDERTRDGGNWDVAYDYEGGFYDWDAGYGPPLVPHVTDGTITEGEWHSAMKLVGKYARMYIDVQVVDGKARLFFLNDWLKNQEGPIHPSCFNRFDFYNAATNDTITVRVYGDHRISVFWNGENVSGLAKGAAGFGPSPSLTKSHSIFEFEMDALNPGTWATALCDPPASQPPVATVTEAACGDPTFILDEPKVANVVVGEGTLYRVEGAPVRPLAYALDTYRAKPEETVGVLGRNLGAIPGVVTLLMQDGTTASASVVDWSDTRIAFAIPKGVKGRVVPQLLAGTETISAPAMCVCAEGDPCHCIARSTGSAAGK